jgi:hypothetical protein
MGGSAVCGTASSNVNNKCGVHTNNSNSYFDFHLMSYS